MSKAVAVKKAPRQLPVSKAEGPKIARVEVIKEAGSLLERLAPHMGREGLIIVGGMIPAHAAAAAGVNPLLAYGAQLACVCLYLFRVWS